jgi:hypothetical protein
MQQRGCPAWRDTKQCDERPPIQTEENTSPLDTGIPASAGCNFGTLRQMRIAGVKAEL